MSATRDRGSSETTRRLAVLTAAECRILLDSQEVGRVVFLDGPGPVALPVNYALDAGDIVFRTASCSSVLASTYLSRVSFEVDDFDDVRREGWSVLATGRITEVDDDAELLRLEELGVMPWAEEGRTRYLRLNVLTITGRRLAATASADS
jgi:nitroimidazol reductase NimA-like FMN-containing flavoprotein (pyridoxamine 5'-phosphate oxidase superfamily)